MRHIYKYLLLLPCLIMLMTLGSCSSDEDTPAVPDGGQTGSLTLSLRVAPQDNTLPLRGITRATEPDGTTAADIPDPEAAEGEMMKSWVVLAVEGTAVEGTSTVAKVYHYEITSGEREVDHIAIDDLKGKTYTFYAFANLTDDQLKAIGVKKADDATNASDFDTDGWLKAGATLPKFSDKALLIKGNAATVDYIQSTGIPMSSKATVHTIASSGNHDYDIYVVRMVAKIRLEVSNPDSHPLLVDYVEIVDSLTANDQGKDASNNAIPNLYLLPLDKTNDPDANGNNRRPVNLYNLRSKRQLSGVTVHVPKDKDTVPAYAGDTDADGNKVDPWTYEFYVNESTLENITNTNGFRLQLQNHSLTGSYIPQRVFAFPDFTRIARNEVHVLPVRLDRFPVQFTVEGFTAIGVVPICTDRPDYALINVGMYGSFHITPTITDWFTGKDITIVGTPTISPGTESDDFTDDFVTEANRPTVSWNSNASTPTIEVVVGNYSGQATYVFSAKITASNGESRDVSRRFRIVNQAINFDDPNWSKRWRGGVKR